MKYGTVILYRAELVEPVLQVVCIVVLLHHNCLCSHSILLSKFVIIVFPAVFRD